MMENVDTKVWIPELPKKRIQELAERIKPIVRFAEGEKGLFRSTDGYLFYIQPVNLFDVAYTWEPKPTEKATDLKSLCDITTYHSFAYYGFFKPSIAEVIAQIPEEWLDRVVAFEIVTSPRSADDLNTNSEALNAGYHVATTRFYSK